MTTRILLSKVVGQQKTKTDGSNSIFNVVGKRETKTESRIPFSDDVGKRKTKLEARIPFKYYAGKRLALRYTHCLHRFKYSARATHTNFRACHVHFYI